jgi:hypothetical protein
MKKLVLALVALLVLTSCSGTEKEEKKTVFGENEVATTDDFEFDIKSVRKSYGNDFLLDDGQLYVVVVMSIKNVSKEKQTVSVFNWKMQNDDLLETDASGGSSTVGGEMISADVLAGGSVEAVFYFEQPLENSGLVLAYYSNMFSEEPELTFKLTTDCSDTPVKATPYALTESVPYRDKLYTVTKVETSAGKDYYKPAAGNVYLGVTIKVKNISTVDVVEIDSADWKIIDGNGVSYDYSIFSSWDTESFYGKELQPGAEYTYMVAFEVPKNGTWRLAYTGNLFEDNAKFSIQLN